MQSENLDNFNTNYKVLEEKISKNVQFSFFLFWFFLTKLILYFFNDSINLYLQIIFCFLWWLFLAYLFNWKKKIEFFNIKDIEYKLLTILLIIFVWIFFIWFLITIF